MSSEMREFVKEMRAGTPCYVAKVGGGRCVNGAECLRCAERLDWADRLERSLLARTEAGAYVPGPAMVQLVHGTHPQDGDAELLDWLDRQAADGVHVEVCCTGNFDARTIARKATVYVGRPQSEHEAASVREAIRNAMQAKEAK